VTRESQIDSDSLLASQACSIEIRTQIVLFSAVLVPLVILVLPFLAFHLGLSLLNLNLSPDWLYWRGQPPQSQFAILSEGEEIAGALIFTLVTIATAAMKYRTSLRQRTLDLSGRRYQALRGDRGMALARRVESLWFQIAHQAASAPEVFWFASASVAARAMNRPNGPAIAVSIGLWERIDDSDQIAEIVLLHELAHVAYGDSRLFARLEAGLSAAKQTLTVMLWTLVVTLGFMMMQCAGSANQAHLPASKMLGQEVMVLSIGLLALSLRPVMVGVVKRYIALITSLIELRADVRGAEWAGGFERYAEILRDHPMVHRSTVGDRARSLFSLELTHISESERIEILENPERLFRPKVGYFVFSLVLCLFLPLNGLTPLFEGGICDLAAVVTVAAALTITASTMLIVAGGTTIRIPIARLLGLSASTVLFTAACQINLYNIGYSLSTVSVSIGNPSAYLNFSGASFLSNVGEGFQGIGDELIQLWGNGWILVSILLTLTAFIGVYLAGRFIQRTICINLWILSLIAATSGLGVVLDGYDPFRGFIIDDTILGRMIAGWSAATARLPGIRFTLGPCLALGSVLLLLVTVVGLNTARKLFRGPRQFDASGPA
jgi:Zn-dependent protease with chaperone function